MVARRKPSPSPATRKRVATQGRARRSATRPPAARTRAQPAVPRIPSVPERFPIVGIGASAGGLEALETFFRHMSPESAIAFVVVMHQPLHHPTRTCPYCLRRCITWNLRQGQASIYPSMPCSVPWRTTWGTGLSVLYCLARERTALWVYERSRVPPG